MITECECNPNGVTDGQICDPSSGACICKKSVAGKKCDECENGYFGFPNCKGKIENPSNSKIFQIPIFVFKTVSVMKKDHWESTVMIKECVVAKRVLLVTDVQGVILTNLNFQNVKVIAILNHFSLQNSFKCKYQFKITANWVDINGKQYWVSENIASQEKASRTCNSMEGFLAEPLNERENEAIVKLVCERFQNVQFWIGVDDIANETK